jgi:uncharacterized DUF497 family protein
MKIAGIEWDHGNWPKCGKHGVSQDEIEYVLRNMDFRSRDPNVTEERYRTALKTPSERSVFVVYTHRVKSSQIYLRPLSARYMHDKEVRAYEQVKKAVADSSNG